MDAEQLKTGNELYSKIEDSNDVLNCFEWTSRNGDPSMESRNPKLFIEFDDYDGESREMLQIPFPLNQNLIEIIKDFIVTEQFKLKKEFKKL